MPWHFEVVQGTLSEATGVDSVCQKQKRKQKRETVDFPKATPKGKPKATIPKANPQRRQEQEFSQDVIY